MSEESLHQMVVDAQAKVRKVDVRTLERWLASSPDLVLIDVREPEEFAAAHIPGALSIPRGLLEAAADRDYRHRHPRLSQARECTVVCCCDCGSAGRSSMAALTLNRMGFRHLYYLVGGLGMWLAEDLPVEGGGAGQSYGASCSIR